MYRWVAPSEIQVTGGGRYHIQHSPDFLSDTQITHRVVDIAYNVNEGYFKAKGNNNPSADPWTVKSVNVI